MIFYKKLSIALSSSHRYLMSFDSMKNGRIIKEYVGYDSIDEYDGRDNMYEIIRGIQRLYFDIDSPINLDVDVIEFIEHCKVQYPNNNVVCYTSHREDKFSYHIVLQDVYARDNIQCKHYCKELLQGSRLEEYSDMKVYRDVQHFRIMGCSKLGVDNKKILWIGSVRSLEDSLVTFYQNREGTMLLDYFPLDYCNMSKSAYELQHTKRPLLLVL